MLRGCVRREIRLVTLMLEMSWRPRERLNQVLNWLKDLVLRKHMVQGI